MNFESKYFEFRNKQINPRILYDFISVLKDVRKLGLIHLPIINYDFIIRQLDEFQLFSVAIRYLTISKDVNSRESLLKDSSDIKSATHFELWFSKDKSSSNNPFNNPGRSLSYPKCCIDKYEKSEGLSAFYNTYLFSNETRHYQLNRLVSIFNHDPFMPDYFPCSLSCDESYEFVNKCNNASNIEFPTEIIDKITRVMKTPLILWGNNLLFIPNWSIDNGYIYLSVDEYVQYQKIESICTVNEENTHILENESPKLLKFKHLLNLEKIVFKFSNKSQETFNVYYI